MTLTALLLIVTSACAHVAWNVVGKKHHPNLPFFAIALVFGNVILAPAILWNVSLFTVIPAEVWQCLVLTSLFQALYMAGLVGAYRSGHLSVAYPLARAIPVLLVALIRVTWSNASLSPTLYLGGFLIVAGALLLPLPTFSDWHWRHYRNGSCLFALVAAVGTTGYSIIDDHGLHLFRGAPGAGSNPVPITIVYAFLESTFTFLWLLPAILSSKVRRKEASIILRNHWKSVFLTSMGMIVGYLLILISLAYVDDVAYVVAFRQLSIPLGALAGVVLLGEPAHRPKVVGVGLLFVGLVLAAFG